LPESCQIFSTLTSDEEHFDLTDNAPLDFALQMLRADAACAPVAVTPDIKSKTAAPAPINLFVLFIVFQSSNL
jgi:hypothetical protein